MDLENIKTTEDVKRYIDGCLNDYEAGIATKEQTAEHIGELITKVITLIKIK